MSGPIKNKPSTFLPKAETVKGSAPATTPAETHSQTPPRLPNDAYGQTPLQFDQQPSAEPEENEAAEVYRVIPGSTGLSKEKVATTKTPITPLQAQRQALDDAERTAALKALLAGADLQKEDNGYRLQKGTLSDEEFQACLVALFGEAAKPDDEGNFRPDGLKTVPELRKRVEAFSLALQNLEVQGDGNLAKKDKVADEKLLESLKLLLGPTLEFSGENIRFQDAEMLTATFSDRMLKTFGPNASLTSEYEVTQREAVREARVTAALQALLGNTRITTPGTSLRLVNEKLSRAQFSAAVETVFGPTATLSADGSFVWDETSGMSGNLRASFTRVFKSLTLTPRGALTLRKGFSEIDVGEDLRYVIGPSTFVANNRVVITQGAFSRLHLNNEFTREYGPDANLEAAFNGYVNEKGKLTADLTAAFKTLVGRTTWDTRGTSLSIVDNKLSTAEFRTAVTSLFGEKGRFVGDGSYVFNVNDPDVARLVGSYQYATDVLNVDVGGQLEVRAGKVSGNVYENLRRVLGPATLVAENRIIFSDSRFASVEFNEQLRSKFGPQGSVDAELQGSIDAEGKVYAVLHTAAKTRLLEMQEKGNIDITSDNRVVVRNSKIDQVELGMLLSMVLGQPVTLASDGKLVFRDHRIDGSFEERVTFRNQHTSANGWGRFAVERGKMNLAAMLNARYEGKKNNASAALNLNGTESALLQSDLSLMGGKILPSGSLHFDTQHRKFDAASFSTNLVSSSSSYSEIPLRGSVVFADGQTALSLKSALQTGALRESLGVGVLKGSVSVYEPDDSDVERKQIQEKGGVWSQRTVVVEMNADAERPVPMKLGSQWVTLAPMVQGRYQKTLKVLSVHPSTEDAKGGRVMALHLPSTVEEAKAMRPYEQVSETGQQTLLLGGNLAVAAGVGPGSVSVTASMYHRISGKMTRDIVKLDDHRVRVSFRNLSGKTEVQSYMAQVGAVPAGLSRTQLSGMLAQMAQVGFRQNLENTKSNEVIFDVTLDLRSPQGEKAYSGLLKNDLSEAQLAATQEKSGVYINKVLRTSMTAKAKTSAFNVGPIDKSHTQKMSDQFGLQWTPEAFSYHHISENESKKNPFTPWNSESQNTLRFAHEYSAKPPSMTKALEQAPTTPFTLNDSTAVLSMQMKVTDPKTSLPDAQEGLRRSLNVARQLGFSEEELGPLRELGNTVTSDLDVKERGVMFGLGDNRFGEMEFSFQGLVGPTGFPQVFSKNNQPRTKAAYVESYLEASSTVLSRQGLQHVLEKSWKAQLQALPDGGFEVFREGQKLGRISPRDVNYVLESLKMSVANPIRGRIGLGLNIGQWEGGQKQPELIHIEVSEAEEAQKALKKSGAFANAMALAAREWEKNQPPSKKEEESEEAFGERLQTWKKTSHYQKPEEFFQHLHDMFRAVARQDASAVPSLALLGLAGPEHIYSQASLKLSQEGAKRVNDAGQLLVQRFAALHVLAKAQATSTEKKKLVLPHEATEAEKYAISILTGGKAKLQKDKKTFESFKVEPDEWRDALKVLLPKAQATGTLPVDDADVRAWFSKLFGSAVKPLEGQWGLHFPALAFVSLNEALRGFGDELAQKLSAGAPPVSVDLTQGWVVKHQGQETTWSDSVLNLGASRTTDENQNWVLPVSARVP